MSNALSPLDDCSRTVGIKECRISGNAVVVVTSGMISRVCDIICAMTPARDTGSERRHEPVFPGFKEMAERRRALAGTLAARRAEVGLSQTQVAARMGTSQSAVARLESG